MNLIQIDYFFLIGLGRKEEGVHYCFYILHPLLLTLVFMALAYDFVVSAN